MNWIETLRTALDLESPPEVIPDKPQMTDPSDYAIWRFLRAWHLDKQLGADHAVLLRQIARWQRGYLFVRKLPAALSQYQSKVGIEVTPAGSLIATPFVPSWLGDDCVDAAKGIDMKPELRRDAEDISAEPYLKSLGFQTWHSQAQKEGAWLAVTAPPGSTSLIALPTGSGKSLCFQMLSRFGTGVTVVIVPTVALAIDQWRSAKETLGHIPDLNPRYFAANDPDLNPETILSDLREGRTRLIFTSPEACVSGRLRNVLDEAARSHLLENLVIDEAHMIESWGMYFRVDFQMLSTLRRNWLRDSEASLRTFLLSATFTPRNREVLRSLYGDGGEWREFVSQRLRPEMTYYSHRFNSDNERREAVRECAWRLPRPAIYYTTKVEEAKKFAAFFIQEGFKHVGCFHGDTPPTERRSLLSRWRTDEIDIMVATSAFGLGVDKPDVRAVVHACMPESIHRYYQEVGRSGRDGVSSVCLLLPTKRDIEVAKELAPKLLSEEKVQQRWESMWANCEAVSEDEYIWKLSPNARRTDLLGMRTGDENIRWNKRLILQLLRAGKLEVLDLEYRSEEGATEPLEWIKVQLDFPPGACNVGSSISAQRDEELKQASEGLSQVQAYLNGQRPICRILQKLYDCSTRRVCGGCRACRREGKSFQSCPFLDFEAQPTGDPPRKVIIDIPDPLQKRDRPAFLKLLRDLVRQKGIRRFACAPEHQDLILELFSQAFSENDPYFYRLDYLPSEPIFDLRPDEAIACFHVGGLNREALDFSLGKEVVHLICAGVSYVDVNRRFPGEAAGWVFYPGLEYWR
ncbi:MAG: ATP-dependent DNA helicase RecQ [Acidobacteria bacterium]|nr:ATP-dependent DNA helicase RecQ [Acidobacteriota bacterium]